MTWREVAMLTPLTIFMMPDSGTFDPEIKPKIVLFPAPFCPIRVNFIPRLMVKLTLSKIGLFMPHSKETLSNLTIVSWVFWFSCDSLAIGTD